MLALRLIALIALTLLSLTIGVAVMVFGWGLHPVSWAWILGGAVSGMLIAGLTSLVIEIGKK